MDLLLSPAGLHGSVPARPSKSAAHRLLICAAAADAPTGLDLPSVNEDIEATARCLTALGAGIRRSGRTVTVVPISAVPPDPVLDCGMSGSTLRFLLPFAAALPDGASFTGSGRLPQRPLGELAAAMESGGVRFSSPALPLSIRGRLAPGRYAVAGDVSSQYVSGLLLGLSARGGGGEIALTSPLESAPYVDMTAAALRVFGVGIERTPSGWRVPPARLRSPGRAVCEGDWSNAAFWLAAGALGGSVTVTGLDPDSVQGDRAIVPLLRAFGARVTVTGNAVTCSPGPLTGTTVSVSDTPDLLPVLAVVAAAAKGRTEFTGAARLRLKESDRLASTEALIRSLGGRARASSDGLAVEGGTLSGGRADSFADHRLAMAAAVAATVCRGPVTLSGAEAVDKSHPGFFEEYRSLGGIAHVL